MCGEHAFIAAMALHQLGSSPHVRGAQEDDPDLTLAFGIIPACAGGTLINSSPDIT